MDHNSQKISARCKYSFDSWTREKGADYFNRGLVSNLALGPSHAVLKVTGTRTYEVSVDWQKASKGEMTISCTCPHYAGGEFCKHTWAALCTLDAKGVGQNIPGNGSMEVFHLLEDSLEEGEYIDLEWNDRLKGRSGKGLDWRRQITKIQDAKLAPLQIEHKRSRLCYYALNLTDSAYAGMIYIDFYQQEKLQSGKLGSIKRARIALDDLASFSDSQDREVLKTLLEVGVIQSAYGSRPLSGMFGQGVANARIPSALQFEILTRLAKTGRFFYVKWSNLSEKTFLQIGEGEPWKLEVDLIANEKNYQLMGVLSRGKERLNVSDSILCLRSGLVVMADRVDRLDSGVNFSWISALREEQFPPVPIKEVDDFIETILSDPDSPKVNWPKSIEWSEEEVEPVPELEISLPSREFGTRGLWAELRLNYGGVRISGHDTRASLLDKPNRRICLRSFEREKELLEKIRSVVGLEPISEEHMFQVAEESFSNAVSEILSWGWRVEAKGKLIRQVADFQIEVVSGVDWFDLKGTATYSTGLKIGIPELIAACQGKDPLIPLGDGTYGMLPSEWLKRYGSLKEVGKNKSDGIRFQKSQGALLAAWLAEEKNLRSDKAFQNLMQGLHAFGKLKARDPGKFFHGKLCPYQKEGLAWLEELKKLDLGGILADDMGLGKTVQILAHLDLEYQRLKKSERLPSLAVLPKSLMFNWKEEAERFAPRLKVLSYEGQGRASLLGEIPNADLVLVTYATLRLDIEKLRDLGFHYVIADEAQAIKNAKSVSHISCSVIRGKHRLALTGTPVENSIEDLFSLLDFVSPGLLGPSLKNRLAEAGKAGSLDTDMISQLAKALRPFILRRTKSQVLKDLPEKSEKVIHCEFSPGELKKYDELREYYRIHLKTEIQNRGLAKSKIVVLEALLRLRQAACHPALIDKRQFKADSAKLDTLLTQVEEAISESHKVLIFSQFTSFLDLVGTALTRRKISFVRLDGQTGAEDRKASVSRFQTDPSLSAFLISLKAGGVGLNLTAADYVFILDPWWNPAAEAQAIDRTHRIGQKNKVMAYRLITKGTVEEKILELQKSKREIADAIISSDSSLLRKLSLDDIELLLS